MMMRRTISGLRSLGDRQIEAIISTANLVKQDGLVLPPKACDLSQYLKNPVVLRGHNQDAPIARSDDLRVSDEAIRDRITFPPEGVSSLADETYGLIRAGVLNAMSIGFDITSSVPIDPNRPGTGRKATNWILFEVSVVGVGADPDSVVTARRRSQSGAIFPQLPLIEQVARARLAHFDAVFAAGEIGSDDYRRRQAEKEQLLRG
jgi:HK97 family phage prohead protease